MKIKRNISFYLERRKVDGEIQTKNLRIRMRLTYSGVSIEFPLICRIDQDKWDKNNSRALPKAKDKSGNTTKDVNDEIEYRRGIIEHIFAKYELIEDRIPTKEEVKSEYAVLTKRKAAENEEEPTIFIRYNDFLKENRAIWSEGTYKKLRTMMSHLKEFDDTLRYNDLNEEKLEKYVAFLSDKKDLRNSTITKNWRLIKWFLNWWNY